jgi:hypothetical protein
MEFLFLSNAFIYFFLVSAKRTKEFYTFEIARGRFEIPEMCLGFIVRDETDGFVGVDTGVW